MRKVPFGVITLILRTCRNCIGVMNHHLHKILARVQNMEEVVKQLAGQGMDLWNAKLGTFGGMLSVLKRDLGGVAKAIGEAFAPEVTPILEGFVSGVRALAESFTGFVRENAAAIRQ